MMIEDNELVSINGGGSVSATLLNTLVKIISTAIELGRTIGSTIRRKKYKMSC